MTNDDDQLIILGIRQNFHQKESHYQKQKQNSFHIFCRKTNERNRKKNKLANQFNEKTNSNVFNSHSHTLLVRNSFLSFFYWPSSSTLMFIVILVVVINVLKKKKNTQIRKQDTNTHTHQTHIDKKIKIKNRREFRLLKLFLSVFSVCYVF